MQEVAIVDKNDNPVGSAEKEYAITNSLIRRLARIIVINSKGEILIQKRLQGLTLSGGKWDQSCGGHLSPNETYEHAAKRETSEELGIVGVSLKEIGYFYYERQHEKFLSKTFNKLFVCKWDGAITLQEAEVAEVKWITIKKLQSLIKNDPEKYTAGLVASIEELLKSDYKKLLGF